MAARCFVVGACLVGAWALSACSGVPAGEPIGSTEQPAISAAPVDAPAIDWSTIGQQAPKPLAIGARSPSDPLPHADVVILTWTSTEWAALDHVFVNSGAALSPSDYSWRNAWQSYTRGASQFSSSGGALWGSFQLVQVTDKAGVPLVVLLFKSNAHLSFQPYISGLRAMVDNILADTQPQRIYSIGTAGAAKLDQKLGDSVVTSSAFLDVTLPPNASDPAAGKTFTSPGFPSLALEQSAEQLMFPLDKAATSQDLQTLFTSVFGSSSGIAPGDVIGSALTNLTAPTVDSMQGVPLDSSDDFGTVAGAGMAPGDGNDAYSAYETDDAVIAQAAIAANVEYASIRNISDPVVPSTTADGGTISDTLRTSWSSALYYRYGFLTSVDGAIATWAAIAGMPGVAGDAGPGGDAGSDAAPGSDAGSGSDAGPGGDGGSVRAAAHGSGGGCGCRVASRSRHGTTRTVLGFAAVALALVERRRRNTRARRARVA